MSSMNDLVIVSIKSDLFGKTLWFLFEGNFHGWAFCKKAGDNFFDLESMWGLGDKEPNREKIEQAQQAIHEAIKFL